MKKLLFMLAMCVATPAMAEPHQYASVGSWYISDNDDGACSMLGEYDQNTSFHIEYNSRLRKTMLTFVDPAYASLKAGDTKTMELGFVNAMGKVDTGWGSAPFRVNVLNEDRLLTATFNGSVMLDDLRRNTRIVIMYNDTVVESLSLKGITPAVNALEACAIAEARQHPVDIFAN